MMGIGQALLEATAIDSALARLLRQEPEPRCVDLGSSLLRSHL
jgi:hypothetical protein